jgi:hypothetical protein
MGMRLARHLSHIWTMRTAYRIFIKPQNEGDHRDVGGWKILQLLLERQDEVVWAVLVWGPLLNIVMNLCVP